MLLLLMVFLPMCCFAQQLLVEKPPPLPPQPYTYAYSAARAPGAKPDRYASQEGDANGVVRGQYAYLDPNYQWQQVAYLADADGFHVDASNLPVANVDTPAVSEQRLKFADQFAAIAQEHARIAEE